MIEKHFILATAGHVDHGKSALVKALTGTDPDRLPEEKTRGITIDLGFAELNLDGPNGEKFHLGVVDVPGHEDFVRNMIAGVGSIDLALLVVAADDGWMPQTEEHLQILKYLGIQRIVVALTKSDLGKACPERSRRIDIVISLVRERLSETPFSNCQIVPTSVRTGDGIEDLKSALASELATLPPPRDIGKPRLFVDRAFTLRGIGTVVTGTLSGGEIQRGQSVIVQPRNLSARVRSIQSHGRDVNSAQPGMRTAINLPDLSIGENGIKRGDLITTANAGTAHDTIDVLLERSTRLNRTSAAARAIKNGSVVQVHFGTSRTPGKITLLEAAALGAGQSAIARLSLGSPILAFAGDRFVIRDSSEQNTVAGGTILDPDAVRSNFRSAAQQQFLKTRATAPHDVDICIRSQLARDGFGEAKTLLVKSNFSANEIADALRKLHDSGEIVLRGSIAADPARWRQLVGKAAELIDDLHHKHPEQRGINLVDLRARLNIESDQAFHALITELANTEFLQVENIVARESHRPSLPPRISPAAEKIRAALAAKPFDPPSRKDLSEGRQLDPALRFLIEQGEIVEVGDGIVLLRDAVDQMQSLVTEFISSNGSATASQLRQKIGTSRRIIIPLLEYLDRHGVTQRIGDQRVLAKKAAAAKLTDAAIAERS